MRVAELLENKEEFPEHAMLKDGFYLKRQPYEGFDEDQFRVLYRVYRLLDDDEIIASAGIVDNAIFKHSWIYRRQTNDAPMEQEKPGEQNVLNFLKFKWWVWNKLISSGAVADAK